MRYKKIKPHLMSESALREIWEEEYCLQKIVTFDGVNVSCYKEMFDHIFYESTNREAKDKSILSYNRLEKIHWIKDTLEDPDAILKKGWDKEKKKYTIDKIKTILNNPRKILIRL